MDCGPPYYCNWCESGFQYVEEPLPVECIPRCNRQDFCFRGCFDAPPNCTRPCRPYCGLVNMPRCHPTQCCPPCCGPMWCGPTCCAACCGNQCGNQCGGPTCRPQQGCLQPTCYPSACCPPPCYAGGACPFCPRRPPPCPMSMCCAGCTPCAQRGPCGNCGVCYVWDNGC